MAYMSDYKFTGGHVHLDDTILNIYCMILSIFITCLTDPYLIFSISITIMIISMSAIDFYCSVDKVKGVDGKDRVVLTLDGKYLPHTEQVSTPSYNTPQSPF